MIASDPYLGECPRCGADMALEIDHESVREACSAGCGYERAPAPVPTDRGMVRRLVRRVRRTRPLLAPRCYGRLHSRCRVSTCECWCHQAEDEPTGHLEPWEVE